MKPDTTPTRKGAYFAVRITYFDGSQTTESILQAGWTAALARAAAVTADYTIEPLFEDEVPRCSVYVDLISHDDGVAYRYT